MRSLVSTILSNKRKAILTGAIVVAALVLVFVASAQATDKSSFCNTCHEMTPYYTAWSSGPHAEVACIECHVDEATTKRLAHKVTALGEVWAHFTTEPLFPMGTAEVPNERCLKCHDGAIDPGIPGFDHETHRGDKSCQTCHFEAGHSVSATALAEAGILDPDAQAAKEARTVAVVGKGAANLDGHPTVSCSSCHDLAATDCSSCHTPKHEQRDASATCTACHAPAAEWTFTHPARTDCATCHEAPAGHYTPSCETCHTTPATFDFAHPAAGTECATCHERPAEHRPGACQSCHSPGEKWTFTHPAAGASCVTCHTKPAKHYTGTCSACHNPNTPFERAVFKHPGASATCTTCHRKPAGHSSATCTTCHKPAASWAFYHPSSTKCASCHNAPAKHYAGSCNACHTPSKPFASAVFKHPGASATCTTCHSKPAGHSGATCTTCHRPAGSWAFYHPTSTNCASCHKAPSNHYGTDCASCHAPGTSWGSATFSHPKVPGGKHTYKSFACAKCHPNGYSSLDCTSCHEDDDD